MADASKAGIGTGLDQGEGDHQQPLAYFSKALLVAYLSGKHFCHYVEGFHGSQGAGFCDGLIRLREHQAIGLKINQLNITQCVVDLTNYQRVCRHICTTTCWGTWSNKA